MSQCNIMNISISTEKISCERGKKEKNEIRDSSGNKNV